MVGGVPPHCRHERQGTAVVAGSRYGSSQQGKVIEFSFLNPASVLASSDPPRTPVFPNLKAHNPKLASFSRGMTDVEATSVTLCFSGVLICHAMRLDFEHDNQTRSPTVIAWTIGSEGAKAAAKTRIEKA